MRHLLAIAVVLFVAAPPAVAASLSEFTGLDVSIKTGMTTGTLTQGARDDGVNPPQAAQSVSYGGLPLTAALNMDLSMSVSLQFELNVHADFSNSQIVGKGFAIGLLYHLLGGSKLVVREHGMSTVWLHETSNLSLLVKPAFTSYGASSTDGLQRVEGAAIELLAGVQYRYDIGEKTSLAVEFANTFITMPASTERTTCSRMEILVSYRFYL